MKNLITAAICVLGACAMAETLQLGGAWRLDFDGEEIAMPVPGGVHGALLKTGKIEDPFWGQNELKVQWVGQRDWESKVRQAKLGRANRMVRQVKRDSNLRNERSSH